MFQHEFTTVGEAVERGLWEDGGCCGYDGKRGLCHMYMGKVELNVGEALWGGGAPPPPPPLYTGLIRNHFLSIYIIVGNVIGPEF